MLRNAGGRPLMPEALGESASEVATALAMRVLPQPGGP